jgi:hypothetical protein
VNNPDYFATYLAEVMGEEPLTRTYSVCMKTLQDWYKIYYYIQGTQVMMQYNIATHQKTELNIVPKTRPGFNWICLTNDTLFFAFDLDGSCWEVDTTS